MKKGFTLVELLIVIAIIGILSSIVASSTTSARINARDARRIASLKEIQLSLALYYDVNKSYPAQLSTLAASDQKYISAIPTDPQGGSYEYLVTGAHYCLGARLEGPIPADSASCTLSGGSTSNYKVYR